jgi:hypothetical protein
LKDKPVSEEDDVFMLFKNFLNAERKDAEEQQKYYLRQNETHFTPLLKNPYK